MSSSRACVKIDFALMREKYLALCLGKTPPVEMARVRVAVESVLIFFAKTNYAPVATWNCTKSFVNALLLASLLA